MPKTLPKSIRDADLRAPMTVTFVDRHGTDQTVEGKASLLLARLADLLADGVISDVRLRAAGRKRAVAVDMTPKQFEAAVEALGVDVKGLRDYRERRQSTNSDDAA